MGKKGKGKKNKETESEKNVEKSTSSEPQPSTSQSVQVESNPQEHVSQMQQITLRDDAEGQSPGRGKREMQMDQPQGRGRRDSQIDQPQGRGRRDPEMDQSQGRGRRDSQMDQSQGRGRRDPQMDQPQGRGRRDLQMDQPQGRDRRDPQMDQSQGRRRDPQMDQSQGRGRRDPQMDQPQGRGRRDPQMDQSQGRGRRDPQMDQSQGRGRRDPQMDQPQGRRRRDPQMDQPQGRGRRDTQMDQPQRRGRRDTQMDQPQGRGDSRTYQLQETREPQTYQPQERRAPQTVAVQGVSKKDPQQPLQQQQQLPPQLKKEPEEQYIVPRRKQIGTKGNKVVVKTNHFPLRIQPKYDTAIHYDVSINPDKPKRMMRMVWESFKKKHFHKDPIAFDDVKNAYAPSKLPFEGEIVDKISLSEDEHSKPREYEIKMKFAAIVNLKELFTYMQSGGTSQIPQEALQCIEVVLKNSHSLNFVKVGRSFFKAPHSRTIELGDGLELWNGFYQSAIIGWKPYLNIDVAHKGFPMPQKVNKLIYEMCPRGLDYRDLEKVAKFLKGLKIIYEIPEQQATRRTFRVNGLHESSKRSMFDLNGVRTSVYDYFLKEKGYKINCPELPVLWVGPRDKKVYVPAELCDIVAGQVVNKKLNETQTANMVRNAATNTNIRKQKILDSLEKMNLNNNDIVRAFGLQVIEDFESIDARCLQPPTIRYDRNNVYPQKGVWRADHFIKSINLEEQNWSVINLDRRTKEDSILNFVRLLQQIGRNLGMQIGNPFRPFGRLDQFSPQNLRNELYKYKAKKILFIVIPDYPTNVYNQVKQIAELEIGCLTQCILSKTMYKMNPSTVSNILLKVNVKLNGRNHGVIDQCKPSCLQTPCMIMGADVTHPSPDQLDIPSVVAITASYDIYAFQYNICWRLQPPRTEIIEDLQAIVCEQLFNFYKMNHVKPERLIFFRDGVSEGEFATVLRREYTAIRNACLSMPGDTYKPKITFLVVQKRHHTRFFPSKPSDTDDRNYNVRAGTVVDRDITHPSAIEYYLVSHASIQGVARPTKYRILWDDSDFSEDDIQELTYYLCHMFSRCTRSVSYPAPTYYAHLAAFRARVYLEGQKINMEDLKTEQARRKIRDEIIQNPMFFV